MKRSAMISSASSFSACFLGPEDIEAEFSGNGGCPLPVSLRRGAFRAFASPTQAPASEKFFDDLFQNSANHFLDSCFLCKKHLAGNRDIYMYRGDMPFCTDKCRQEQIEMDEAKENNWKPEMKLSRSFKYHKIRAGTVVAG